MSEVNTQILEDKAVELAEGYRKKYPEQVEALEGSLTSKINGCSEFMISQLGKQLDSAVSYQKMCEANGTLNNLGQLPRISLDVITAVMGASPIASMASVQAIEAQKGIIHFRNVSARTTKGNRTDGDVFVDPRTGEKFNKSYASNKVQSEVIGAGDGMEDSFTAILSFKPSRSQFLSVGVVGNAAIRGKDLGPDSNGDKNIGQIYGQGVSGTVNYLTGSIELVFEAPVANMANIVVSYQENYEAAEDIPKIESYWDSVDIEAKVFALKATIGMLQAYTLQKQYGESAKDELSKDLVRAINTEIMGEFIELLLNGAQGLTTFDLTPGAGVSFFENKMQYFDQKNLADSTLVGNAGRGQISVMIAGREHCALVAGLPGFERLTDGRSLGAHIYGRVNDTLYIRVPQDDIMGGGQAGARRGVGLFKGDSPFDAACVYSPFMPLMVTSDIPELRNPLITQRAAATMAGVDLIVPQYATNFNVIKS
jgi:hypothetical protein